MSNCVDNCQHSSVCQTLDELDFERGIWFAALHNDIPRVKQLIQKTKNVNIQDKAGYTALHYASRSGHLDMCELLISHGADVNALTRAGRISPLHRCVSAGHLQIFKLLLRSGASINAKDGDGKTILHRAVEGGHFDLVQEILKLNPQLTKETDNKGNLAKSYANTEILNCIINQYN